MRPSSRSHVQSQVLNSSASISRLFRNEDQFLVLTLSTSVPNTRSAVLRNIESGEETKLGTEIGQQQNDEVITAVTFDHRGQYVFIGTTKGRILLYDSKTRKHFKTVCQSVSHQVDKFRNVSGIRFRSGTSLLLEEVAT